MIGLSVITMIFSSIISFFATKSWFSPSSFFAISWLFFTSSPIIFAPEYSINKYGILYIALAVMSCSSGGVFASLIKNKLKNNSSKLMINNCKKLRASLIFFNMASMAGILSLLFYIESFYLSTFTYSSWQLVPNLISVDRYSGNLVYPIYIKYLLYFIYPANIVSGILINTYYENKKKIVLFLPLFFSIALGLIEGSRTSILLGSILFFSSWLSSGVILYKEKNKFSHYKVIFLINSFILFFLVLFIFVQWLRQGLDPIFLDLITARIKAYFFGYLSAFTLWFESMNSVFTINSFLSTFAGPISLLGGIERDLGFYEPILISKEVSTNIYTALRSIISDFSITGSLIFIFLIGFASQIEFQKRTTDIFTKVLFMSAFYSFTLYSPLISIFHYNSIFFSWFIIFFILKLRLN